jgi:hypothetical protein
MSEIEVITENKEVLKLTGLSLYQSELYEKLDVYKKVNAAIRKHWTENDLDVFVKKTISNRIVENEFGDVKAVGGKKKRKLTDKEMILKIAQELNFEIIAIKHVYDYIKDNMSLYSNKQDAKDYLTSQIYDMIDMLDLEIANSETEKDRQQWYDRKLKAMSELKSIENLETKANNNTAIVHGNVINSIIQI